MRVFRVLAAAALIAGLSASPLLAEIAGSVSGRAVDATGRPLANLRVELVEAFRGHPVGVPVQASLTDRRGAWSFSGVSAGQYVVRMVQRQRMTGVAVSVADASEVVDVSLVAPSLPPAAVRLQGQEGAGQAGGQAAGGAAGATSLLAELPAIIIGAASAVVVAAAAVNSVDYIRDAS